MRCVLDLRCSLVWGSIVSNSKRESKALFQWIKMPSFKWHVKNRFWPACLRKGLVNTMPNSNSHRSLVLNLFIWTCHVQWRHLKSLEECLRLSAVWRIMGFYFFFPIVGCQSLHQWPATPPRKEIPESQYHWGLQHFGTTGSCPSWWRAKHPPSDTGKKVSSWKGDLDIPGVAVLQRTHAWRRGIQGGWMILI